MKGSMNEQPWKVAQLNLEKMKMQIGDAMTGPMSDLINKFSDLTDKIMAIPEAPGLIGMAALGIGALGAISMLIGVMSPLGG